MDTEDYKIGQNHFITTGNNCVSACLFVCVNTSNCAQGNTNGKLHDALCLNKY